MNRLAFALTVVALVGCKHPADAPDSLDELCGYLYGHVVDEDPEYLESGLANLVTWLEEGDNLESTFEGYTLSKLDQSTVDALDERERDLDELVGAAVGTEGVHDPFSITDVFVTVDPVDLSPGMYMSYEREFITDADCFMSMECDTLDVFNVMESKYAGFLEVKTETNGQYRWVEMDEGTAMVQRTWMEDSAEFSVDWIDVDQQFYLNVVMPYDGGSLRLQSTWVVASLGAGSVPEGYALQTVIGSMQDIYVDVDLWLNDHSDGAVEATGACATAPVGGLSVIVLLGVLARRREEQARVSPVVEPRLRERARSG